MRRIPSRCKLRIGHFGRFIGSSWKLAPAEPADLGVGIGEQSTLQKRIIGEVDARDHMAGMKGRLLGLGEEIHRVSVEDHPPDHFDRHDFFGDDFGRIEHVEIETSACA